MTKERTFYNLQLIKKVKSKLVRQEMAYKLYYSNKIEIMNLAKIHQFEEADKKIKLGICEFEGFAKVVADLKQLQKDVQIVKRRQK